MREIGAELERAVLRLNNAHSLELSYLDGAGLGNLLRQAFYARATGNVDAFLIALDEGANYDSPNYAWFRERYDRFIYVDRVVVQPSERGRGMAKRLYADLASRAVEAGHRMMACEVNSDPPNPASDAFHARIGFVPVGVAAIHGGAKTVRYLVRSLPDAASMGDLDEQSLF